MMLDFIGLSNVLEPRLNASALDLKPLYHFVQVAGCGSFSRAAAMLSTGQPLISRSVRILEQELQVQLLYRHGRGVSLTPAGELLLEHARAIFRHLSQTRAEIAALGGLPAGRVEVSMLPLLGDIVAIDLIKRLRTEYPLVSVHIREGYTTDSLEWLAAGEVDISIMFNAPNIATLMTEPVLDDEIHLVGALNSLDVIPGADVPARTVAELPLILPPPPHRLRALIEQAVQQAGGELRVEAEISGIATLLELVKARVGYTVLPSTLLLGQLKEGHLQSWRITDPVVAPRLYSATSMQRPQTMASKIVLKTIMELFAQRGRAARRLHDGK